MGSDAMSDGACGFALLTGIGRARASRELGPARNSAAEPGSRTADRQESAIEKTVGATTTCCPERL